MAGQPVRVAVSGAPVRQIVGSGGGSTGFDAKNQVVRPNDREIFHQPLYDRVELAASLTGDYSFFTVPVGSNATLLRYETSGSISKTKRDTNLPSNGQDPSKDYAVFGMAAAFIPNARTVKSTAATNGLRRDIDNIREGGYINFKIIDKQILDLPLLLIPEINAAGSVASSATDVTVFGGAQSLSAMWSFGEPIMIPKSTYFSFKVTFDGTITLAQIWDMYIFLFAKVRRPV